MTAYPLPPAGDTRWEELAAENARLRARIAALEAQLAIHPPCAITGAAGPPCYLTIAETADDMIIIYDAEARFIFVNERFCTLMGYSREEVLGRPVLDLIHPDDRALVGRWVAARLAGAPVPSQRELRGVTREGTVLHVQVSLQPFSYEGRTAAVQAVVRDVTERKQLEEALAHRAYHDPLTDLANRALLIHRLEMALARQRSGGARPALLYLDLDGFKAINDTFGHLAGDHLLVEVASRLRAGVRPRDTVARPGGDEFAVLLDAVSGPGDATSVAERLLAALREPYEVDGRPVRVTTSIGVALTGNLDTKPDELRRLADRALYQAKAAGRNGYVLLTGQLGAAA